jgi:hypothetical protein
LTRHHGRGWRQQHEVVVGDGILVFLAEKLLFNQNVDARRERIRKLALKEHDAARVLVSAPNELLFLLALHHVRPHGQRHAHEHGHHAEANQQRGHRVALLSAGTAPLARRSFSGGGLTR